MANRGHSSPIRPLARRPKGAICPIVDVTSLSLSIGNIDPNTGMPNLAGPYDPNTPTPSEATAGPGRLAGHDLSAKAPSPSTWRRWCSPPTPQSTRQRLRHRPDGTPLVETATPLIDGLSAITAFGNATRITIVDETPSDPTYGQVIGGFDPSNLAYQHPANWTNSVGDFSIPINAGVFMSNGLKTIEIFATDDAASVGNKVTLSFTLNDNNLPQPPPTTPPTATLAISTSAVKETTSGTFTFIGTLTSGSPAVTAISNPLGLVAGQTVTGTGIPSGTTIQTVDSTPSAAS